MASAKATELGWRWHRRFLTRRRIDADSDSHRHTDKSFRVVFNGREVIAFAGNRLGNMIIEGFIGARPPSEELRAGLLGVAVQ